MYSPLFSQASDPLTSSIRGSLHQCYKLMQVWTPVSCSVQETSMGINWTEPALLSWLLRSITSVIKPGLDLVTYSILATIDMEGLILGLSWVHKRPIFSNRRASLVSVSKPERIAEISDDLNQSLRSDSTSTSGILKLAILKVWSFALLLQIS
jgi:hypothetical protein